MSDTTNESLPVESPDVEEGPDFGQFYMPSFPMYNNEETSRKVTITLPTVDTLGIQEGAPTIEVEATSDGSNLLINVTAVGMARSPQEYDAIIHLMATAI